MDRDGIQRRDFPTGRRGYDPAAVDEHLRRVADAFESNSPLPAPSFAASTSDQVREILEAAERSVASVRAEASREASDHVSQVQQATAGMLAKLDDARVRARPPPHRPARLRRTPHGRPRAAPGRRRPAPPGSPSQSRSRRRSRRSPPTHSGARLIALNMALSGTSREETAAYLAEHFELADPDALLDDVYARAGR